MTQKTRILIVDDHAIFRHGLRDILENHFPGTRVGEAETGQGAIDRVRNGQWDIVVLDVTLPGRNGIEVLQEIRQLRPALPVLMLSMHPEEQYAMRVLKAGAAGYITKIKAPLAIVEAVKCVLASGKYIDPVLAKLLIAQANGAEKLPHDRLSPRERQIIRLIPSGKTLKAIAAELSVSAQTVSTYRARIRKKKGLSTTVELIRYALENEL